MDMRFIDFLNSQEIKEVYYIYNIHLINLYEMNKIYDVIKIIPNDSRKDILKQIIDNILIKKYYHKDDELYKINYNPDEKYINIEYIFVSDFWDFDNECFLN